MGEGTQTPAEVAVKRLYRDLLIDPEWCFWHDGGFTWWSYRLAQHVTIGDSFSFSDGQEGYPVHIWTEVVSDVEDAEAAEAVLSFANNDQTMSALVWDPDRRLIREGLTVVVYDDTVESWARTLSVAAIFQNSAAHSRCLELAHQLSGLAAVSSHPESGPREVADDLLRFPSELSGRASPSRFRGDILARLPSFDLKPWLEANGDSTGFTAEFTCLSDVTGAMCTADPQSGPIGTALLQIFTEDDHPDVGSGALLVLRVPHTIPDEEVPRVCNLLNTEEAEIPHRVPAIGAWCHNFTSDEGIAHVTFLPSVLAAHGLLENFAIYSSVRARWVADVL